MRYIEVERVDETYNRVEYEQYCFPDSMTNDDIACGDLLIEDFEEFVNDISVDTIKADGNNVDDYIENCGWWFYEIDPEAYENGFKEE